MRGHRSSNVVDLFNEVDVRAVDWARLYEEHAPRIRRIVGRRVDAATAEDLVQETFLRAFRNRHSLHPGRPPGPWLNTIASRVVTDALRHRYASLEVLDTVDSVGRESTESTVADTTEEAFLDSVRRIGIKRGFASLNHRHRRVLQLVAVEGMTNKQAAEFEDMSVEAVESVLARSRSKFKLVYTSFADHTGVLGGAVLGPVALRLRLRLQRLLDAAGQHTGAVAAAAVTISVMAIAALPAARPTATGATEQVVATHAGSAPTGVTTSGDADTTGLAASVSTSGQTVQAGRGQRAGNQGGGTGGGTTVHAETTAGRQGPGAKASFTGSAGVPQGDQRVGGAIEVYDCSAKPTSTVLCIVIDVLTLATETAPTPD